MHLVDPSMLGNNSNASFRALEEGNILFFPRLPFDFSAEDREALLAASQVAGAHHKNIAYRPKQDRVSNLGGADPALASRVHASLKNFSLAAIQFVGDLLPAYRSNWHVDYASFRPLEEEGRDLPWKKRNDLLHTDAFPTRPTNGDLILRFFTNINPVKSRVWITSEPFSKLAPRLAAEAGIERIAAGDGSPMKTVRRLSRFFGFPMTDRSPYDRFMLTFHDFLKKNQDYQKGCTRFQFEFPPNSAWMAFTDIVPHAVLSGQYALEQTFIVARNSLAFPELAPVSILENLARKPLTI